MSDLAIILTIVSGIGAAMIFAGVGIIVWWKTESAVPGISIYTGGAILTIAFLMSCMSGIG